MKIAFYDLPNDEKKYLINNLPNFCECLYFQENLNENTEIVDINIDAISISITSKLSSDILRKFRNLKYIFTRSVGFNQIDLKYTNLNNIKVFNTPNYGNNTVAEFMFGILLSVIRKIPLAFFDIKDDHISLEKYKGIELYGKTIGIIGLGSIGKRVEKIAQGFSMETICYDILPCEGYNMVTLDELFKNSDIISLNIPLNKNTHHIINEYAFKMMKKGVVIVNTARGELIDTEKLVENINNNKIAYAALDVLECEMTINNVFSKNACIDCVNNNCLKKYILNRKLILKDNVITTPHIAYNTKEAVQRILDITIQNISNTLTGNYNNLVK